MNREIKDPLKIIPFRNRAGSISYRVTGTLNGERIQKNSPTLEAAENQKAAILTAAMQGQKLRPVMSRLNDMELLQSEAAAAKLKEAGKPGDLIKAVDYYLENHRAVDPVETGAAISGWLDACERRGVRAGSLKVRGYLLKDLCKGRQWLSEVSKDRMQQWAFAPDNTRSQRDRRDLLINWGKWLADKGYVDRNPGEEIDRVKVRKSLPAVFTPRQCRDLLVGSIRDGGAVLLPYLTVCLFTGVRPNECLSLTSWDSFNLDGRWIDVPENVSKTRARFVSLTPEVAQILRWCKDKGLKPGQMGRKKLMKVRKKAGVGFPWKGPHNDVLRHCYASYHHEIHHDAKELSRDMGNSIEELRRSYLRRVGRRDALRFMRLPRLAVKILHK